MLQGCGKGKGSRSEAMRGALLDAFPMSHLPTPGQECAGLGGYREGHTCDCVGKEKQSTANVRSRPPLSPSHHFGKPCPGVMPGPRRTGVGKQDSPKGSGNMGYIQPSLAGQPMGQPEAQAGLLAQLGRGSPSPQYLRMDAPW